MGTVAIDLSNKEKENNNKIAISFACFLAFVFIIAFVSILYFIIDKKKKKEFLLFF